MAIVWVASKLVIAFLIAKAFGQCPAEDITIGPGEIFSGKVEVGGEDDPQYVLLDDKGDRPGATGIHFVAGCNKVNEGEENLKVVLRLKNGAQALAFVLQQDPDPEIPLESKFLQLRPNVSYAELLPLPHSVNIIVEVTVRLKLFPFMEMSRLAVHLLRLAQPKLQHQPPFPSISSMRTLQSSIGTLARETSTSLLVLEISVVFLLSWMIR